MKIVVIIPTYNEYINIERLIPLLENEIFPKIKNHDMYILVADDQSPDKTSELVESFMKKWENIELLEGSKEGLGAAYSRAMTYAMDKMKAEAVIEFDADFQHDPQDIPRLVNAMDEGADYVIGSRYIPGGEIPPDWGIHRKIMSIFGNFFARIVLLRFNIHDATSGYKLTKTEFLRKVDLMNLYSKYYAYKIHILHDVLKGGAKVKEVPIIFYERKEGSSKISKKDLFDSFFVVLRLRLRDSKRFVKFLIVGGTGFMVQLLMQETSAFLGAHDSLAVGIGAESAILSNFMINHSWTFRDTSHVKENKGFFRKLVKFNTSSLASILIQVTAVTLVTYFVGPQIRILTYTIPTRIAVVIPTIILIIIPLNYLVYNKVIWKTQYLSHGKNHQK